MDNFIVSARKYRPATFESVVGQKHITSTLRNAISRGQLAHAYLFCGPRGVGKTTCARIFAKAINCLTPGDEACGECESCRSFNEGRSFNIHELDAASNNSVDDIRSLTEQVRIPPQIGRYSVYIIDEVHMLSAAAFNAFLKTLEEPPAHAVFVLATTEKHKIIPTILSRCQIFDFNRIRVEDGVEYLKYIAGQENIAADDESLHLIARKADGGMRDALSMFDKAVSFCGSELRYQEVAATLNVLDYDTYFRIVDQVLEGDYPTVLRSFDEVLSKGFSPQVFVTGMNAHFRDLLMTRDQKTTQLLEVTGTLLEKYRQQGAQCDPGMLFRAIDLLTATDGTLRSAANQRLNVELALMKLCALGQKKNSELNGNSPVSSLIADNDSVESAELPPLTPRPKAEAPAAPRPSQASQPTPQAPTQQKQPEPEKPVEERPAAASDTAPATPNVDAVPAQAETDRGVEPSGQPTVEEPVRPTATQEQATAAQPVPEQKAAPAPTVPPQPSQPTQPAQKTPLKTPLAGNGSAIVSGTSISDLLARPKTIYHEAEAAGEQKKEEKAPVDPQSEQKIEAVREAFFASLNADRPRIAMAFHTMKLSGNTISLAVPTEALREEILRNRTEILSSLAEMAGVTGMLELSVEVKEDAGPKRPVKAEEKLRYLVEKNPAVAALRKKLDLEIE